MHRTVFRVAEDDRAVAEGSASRNLQGGMGLHLRSRHRLQLSPYAESGDSSDVGQGRSVFAGPKRSASHQRMQLKLFPESQNRGAWRERNRDLPFSAAC
jgi:hypothetical protein